MIRTFFTASVLLFSTVPLFCQGTPPEFTSLFNGKDLSGWRGRPQLAPGTEDTWADARRKSEQVKWNKDRDLHWSAQKGELINDGHGVFLTTEKDYGDFELLLEYKTVPMADSGIYLRGCPQVQIWDTREEGGKWKHGADKGSGGLWNNQKEGRFPTKKMDRSFGEWNSLRILMVGARTSVIMNGVLIVDMAPLENYFNRDMPVPATGPIQLQTHGGEIRFRNLHIREIPHEEANRILQAHHDQGYRSHFNGWNLNGWEGPTDHYMIQEGAICCRPGHGGTIYTEEEFGDFSVKFEFQMPEGGNNGLAIRYPGQGDTAYMGMCELQVLDNTAEKYARLKDYQYHGSAYGMVPAKRGYLRPPGSWNYQEVTVQGSTIKVELNGTIILDTDLSTIEKPLSGRDHPGRTRTKGHFGFAGHNDPVKFRNIRIKRLGS